MLLNKEINQNKVDESPIQYYYIEPEVLEKYILEHPRPKKPLPPLPLDEEKPPIPPKPKFYTTSNLPPPIPPKPLKFENKITSNF